MQFEYSLTAKWLELLKQIAPGVTRAAVLRDSTIAAGIGQFAVIQSVAPSVGIEVSPINGRDASETPIDLDTNDVGGVAVTFFNRPAQLSGMVHDARGNPDQTASVLLFPADYRAWIQEAPGRRQGPRISVLDTPRGCGWR